MKNFLNEALYRFTDLEVLPQAMIVISLASVSAFSIHQALPREKSPHPSTKTSSPTTNSNVQSAYLPTYPRTFRTPHGQRITLTFA